MYGHRSQIVPKVYDRAPECKYCKTFDRVEMPIEVRVGRRAETWYEISFYHNDDMHFLFDPRYRAPRHRASVRPKVVPDRSVLGLIYARLPARLKNETTKVLLKRGARAW